MYFYHITTIINWKVVSPLKKPLYPLVGSPCVPLVWSSRKLLHVYYSKCTKFYLFWVIPIEITCGRSSVVSLIEIWVVPFWTLPSCYVYRFWCCIFGMYLWVKFMLKIHANVLTLKEAKNFPKAVTTSFHIPTSRGREITFLNIH